MATPVMEAAPKTADPTLRERVVDAARRVAHVSHEARMLKSVAADAAEAGVYKARRAVRIARRDMADAHDAAVYRIKREPLKAVGAAFGAGALAGAATLGVAWLIARAVARREA